MDIFSLIGFIASCLGILAYISSIIISLRKFKQKAEECRRNKSIQITNPKTGAKVHSSIFDEFKGIVKSTCIEKYHLCVLARNQYEYFLMYPFPIIDKVTEEWSQRNIRLKTHERWELHICLVNKRRFKLLNKKVKNENWSGFYKRPRGIEIIDSIEVEKIIQNPIQRVAASVRIKEPKPNEIIKDYVYDGMRGSFLTALPKDFSQYTFWVIIRDRYNYFLMYPPTQIFNNYSNVHEELIWGQTNVRLSTPGRWELHLCITNKAGNKTLQDRVYNNEWGGFPILPDGVESLQFVVVQRKINKKIVGKLERLEKNMDKYKRTIKKNNPKNSSIDVKIGDKKRGETTLDIKGTLLHELPEKHKLCLVLKRNRLFYQVKDEILMDGLKNWKKEGVLLRLRPEERNRLYIYQIDPNTIEWRELRFKAKMYSGRNELPNGYTELVSYEF